MLSESPSIPQIRARVDNSDQVGDYHLVGASEFDPEPLHGEVEDLEPPPRKRSGVRSYDRQTVGSAM